MEQVTGANAGDTTFLVSGQVLVYGGRNYLLPTYFQTVDATQGSGETAADAPDADPDPEAPGQSADPTVEELLQGLDAATEGGPPALMPPAADAPPAGLRREGSFVSLRRGRLMLREGGRWEFVFDNDAESAEEHDAPLTILPCLLLERMVEEAQRADPLASFTVSGRVFVYGGRNYLLPTMFTVAPPRGTKDARNSGLTTAQ